MEPDKRSNRRLEPTRSEIFEREKSAIARRIRRVCASMPETEFDSLVTQIAEIEIKYRLRREIGI
jgi:hypothetical protein